VYSPKQSLFGQNKYTERKKTLQRWKTVFCVFVYLCICVRAKEITADVTLYHLAICATKSMFFVVLYTAVVPVIFSASVFHRYQIGWVSVFSVGILGV